MRVPRQGVKAFQQGPEALGGDEHIHPQGKFRFPARGHSLHPAFQFRGGPQQMATIPQQGAARRGEGGPATGFFKEGHPQFRLQLLHGVGQG